MSRGWWYIPKVEYFSASDFKREREKWVTYQMLDPMKRVLFMFEERKVLHGYDDSHSENRKHTWSLRFLKPKQIRKCLRGVI